MEYARRYDAVFQVGRGEQMGVTFTSDAAMSVNLVGVSCLTSFVWGEWDSLGCNTIRWRKE